MLSVVMKMTARCRRHEWRNGGLLLLSDQTVNKKKGNSCKMCRHVHNIIIHRENVRVWTREKYKKNPRVPVWEDAVGVACGT